MIENALREPLNLFELWEGARGLKPFQLEAHALGPAGMSANVPAPMKIMQMNFGFAGFLWRNAFA
jgi:hypothetical protein